MVRSSFARKYIAYKYPKYARAVYIMRSDRVLAWYYRLKRGGV